MSAKSNKWLVLDDDCVMTPAIEPTIIWLDQFFEKRIHKAVVTRGLVTPNQHLQTIRQYMRIHGFDKKYPSAMTCKLDETVFDTKIQKSIYVWQMAWSELLNRGVIINPALPAICLMDYYGPDGKGVNRKGSWINQTPHVRGGAFDIGGRGGLDKTIKDELLIIREAFRDNEKPVEWINYLPERKNNCIHNDCKIN